MTAALEFHHVTKRYRSTTYRSLRQDLLGGDRSGPTGTALDDVSFAIDDGDACAIIGPNGAGKSTALRLAAGITTPTRGEVRVRGRVGALIEVGAGIHPELTGRENIWLYGAILGLKRRDIAKRFDDIVEFAELGHVLDQAVKRYSSGMQLRLGFSIAAGVEPDILVVDEALAVGDARFQVRCVERMQALVHSGTTLVYVSHDLASVGAVCRRAVVLIDGRVHHDGDASSAIGSYVDWLEAGSSAVNAAVVVAPGDPVEIRVPLPADRSRPLTIALGLRDGHPWNLLGATTTLPAGFIRSHAVCRIHSLPLGSGVYQVWAAVDGDRADGTWTLLQALRVEEPNPAPRPVWLPAVAFDHTWS